MNTKELNQQLRGMMLAQFGVDRVLTVTDLSNDDLHAMRQYTTDEILIEQIDLYIVKNDYVELINSIDTYQHINHINGMGVMQERSKKRHIIERFAKEGTADQQKIAKNALKNIK
ncbi:hypothetical protein H9L19_07895 [Weissella diestrammenae]|uniref:Uncharacterized protein n=1 Tax=Weissella diestrammenae TaxID=1162633 RepID=A0A7G9T597_9LACO|nr:hypothetical protein [Weissella diestrammenae]MCM0583129.1 hypothetical protein [Weissella diestrammenae]QNN75272.1 hypothetical protein H9L19_07895 [Weissella diestrammenae]